MGRIQLLSQDGHGQDSEEKATQLFELSVHTDQQKIMAQPQHGVNMNGTIKNTEKFKHQMCKPYLIMTL